jgi:indole-3-glycerol phosphate synthase
MTTAGADLLATIVAAARRVVQVREAARPARLLAREQTRTPDGAAFARALRGADADPARSAPRIIAECKRRSPSKGILRLQYDPAAHARAYAEAGAAAISVLTEPTFFDGAPEHLRAVRAAIDLPILRKDFIVSEYQVLEAAVLGADAVLLIVGALTQDELMRLLRAGEGMGLAALVEVHDAAELGRALGAGARIIGVNSRNLRTLAIDPGMLDLLAARLPREVTSVAESGIRTPADIARLSAAGYDAFLVGERLIAQPDPGAALRELRAAAGQPGVAR